jgi:hypothetical protein
VPYDDFAGLYELLLPLLTPQCLAHSLEENTEQSAIVAGYLS